MSWFLPGRRSGERHFSRGLFVAAFSWDVVAIVGALAYTRFDPSKGAIALLATFASASVGSLVGFLFGIPKARTDSGGGREAADGTFKPNTNLEQVSDWLTKIIVGVGLLQFREIGAAIYVIGQTLGAAVGPSETPLANTVFAVVLVVSNSVLTFLLMYMWTTTRLYDVFSAQSPRGSPIKPSATSPSSAAELVTSATNTVSEHESAD